MAYWGMAMSLLANPLRLPINPQALRQGWAAVVQAKRLGGPTPREQAYIDAVEVFFEDSDRLERSGRELAYEQAMASCPATIERIERRRSCMRRSAHECHAD